MANGAKKRPVLAALCCLLLVFSLAGFAFSSPADVQPGQPELIIMGREVHTYDLDGIQWRFPLQLVSFGPGVGTARLVEFSIDAHNLLHLVPEPQRTMPVIRLDEEIDRKDFRKWNDYRQRAAVLRVRDDERTSFSAAEEREFRGLNKRVMEIGDSRRDISPVELTISVADLPFKVAGDGHHKVRVVVERGQLRTVWEGEIIMLDVEPLATNPVWTPADLHIHSSFAEGGPYTPAQLSSFLQSIGYRIGYVTDEPAGWGMTASSIPAAMSGSGVPGQTTPRATWAQYRDAVRNASTTQVAMFPGLEISASTQQWTHTGQHNGHALAYGIGSLTGSGAFEGTGLRYAWFLPNTLLNNINNNSSAQPSSAAIAHPAIVAPWGGHPWNVWSTGTVPLLTARYDGFELMTAGQTSFGPGASPMPRWRQELVQRLPGVFNNMGFPSARTGSDYGNRWWTWMVHDISYFTFIGLPSPLPSDMRNLSQVSVDQTLRAGRTVASRLGGIAALRLRNAQGNLQEIGSWFTMPANGTVSGDVVLRASSSGNYRVRLVEDNFRREWTLHNASLNAGQTIVIPLNFTFPGGQRFYHIIVEHTGQPTNDFIYTSPIFIRQ
ncbi:MAG: hypothetical protein KGZ41_03610 [Dethiobacter sp.]|nr:hypothetical protein [Dethiobacter sp.]